MNEKTPDSFTDITLTLSQALDIICTEIPNIGGPSYRVPPLILSRLARGGKTTVLRQLFDKLKEQGCAPIIINFNGDTTRRKGESDVQLLLRLIGSQFVVDVPDEDMESLVCDQQSLMKHIDTTSDGKPVVLLIDELNALGTPINGKLGVLLKREFLDKKNRYLVYTSHVPMTVDTPLKESIQTGSGRQFKMVAHMPQTTDLQLLQSMSKECGALTPTEMVLYGGIPALIYSVKTGQIDTSTRVTGDKDLMVLMRNGKRDNSLLLEILSSFLQGTPILDTHFHTYSTVLHGGEYFWPPCYMKGILSLFSDTTCQKIGDAIGTLFHDAQRIGSGKDWEGVVSIGILLRLLQNTLHRNSYKFPFPVLFPEHHHHHHEVGIDNELFAGKDSDDARKAILDHFDKNRDGPRIVLFNPQHNNFPTYDGFVCSRRTKNGPPEQIIGYQCKTGQTTVSVSPFSWVNRSYLLRGDASSTGYKNSKGWIYLEVKEMKDLLGLSLAQLYPADLPVSAS